MKFISSKSEKIAIEIIRKLYNQEASKDEIKVIGAALQQAIDISLEYADHHHAIEIKQAIEEEREACAKVAEKTDLIMIRSYREQIATAIRQRGKEGV